MTRMILALSCAAVALTASASFAQPPSYDTNIANAPGGMFKAKVGKYPMSAYVSPPQPLPYDQLDAYLRAPHSQQLAKNWWGSSELASTATTGNVSATTANTAATPPAKPAAAKVSAGGEYGPNIANAPGGNFKAKVGNYPMSAYVSPPRPLPYDQLDAYLRAPHSQQLAKNWWAGSELASTATTGDVSATPPAPGPNTSVNPAVSVPAEGEPGPT